MKRKLLKAIGIVVLIGISELSREDFSGIQQATRQAMWRKAFPNGSLRGMIVSPRVLWRLATTRIHQIQVYSAVGAVEVQTRSGSGDYFYHLVNRSPGTGKSDWRVVGAGPGRQIHVVSIGGWGEINSVKVGGGLGLIGGTITSGDDEEYMNSFLRRAAAGTGGAMRGPASPESQSAAPILTYQNRPPFDPYATPGSVSAAVHPPFSESAFSSWLSNHPPALKLGR